VIRPSLTVAATVSRAIRAAQGTQAPKRRSHGNMKPIRTLLRGATIPVGVAAVIVFLWLAGRPAAAQPPPAGQFPPYRPARMADGHPDLNGIWQALVTANWDL